MQVSFLCISDAGYISQSSYTQTSPNIVQICQLLYVRVAITSPVRDYWQCLQINKAPYSIQHEAG
uniref:Uncharacterized protein n=1 Tax=Arundo donax TaxID=35708 RepID=A0A0A8Y6V5_ARUDO